MLQRSFGSGSKNAQQYLDAYTGGGTQLSAAFTPMPYGLPGNTNINYGGQGFPQWIYDLAATFGIEASTYGGHQLNAQGQNTGIDWRGNPKNLEAFANYLLSLNNPAIKPWVIYQTRILVSRTGISMGRPVGPDLAGTTDPGYYSRGKNDWIDHTDHFHTAFSAAIPSPGQGYRSLPSIRPVSPSL